MQKALFGPQKRIVVLSDPYLVMLSTEYAPVRNAIVRPIAVFLFWPHSSTLLELSDTGIPISQHEACGVGGFSSANFL